MDGTWGWVESVGIKGSVEGCVFCSATSGDVILQHKSLEKKVWDLLGFLVGG